MSPKLKLILKIIAWSGGVYATMFSISLSRYENSVAEINSKTQFVLGRLDAHRASFRRLFLIQEQQAPIKPKYLCPASVFLSFFGEEEQKEENREAVKQFVEDYEGDMSRTVLSKLDLSRTYLPNKVFDTANFQLTNLDCSNLEHISAKRANFSGASIKGNVFSEVNFEGASFRPNHQPNGLFTTNLSGSQFYNCTLKSVSFANANMHGVRISGGDLTGADFQFVSLKDVSIRGANAKGIKVAIDQVCQLYTAYETTFDSSLLVQIQKKCPHILDDREPLFYDYCKDGNSNTRMTKFYEAEQPWLVRFDSASNSKRK